MSLIRARGDGRRFDHTPGSDRWAGYIEEFDATDNFVGVYTEAVESGELGSVAVEGVFEMDKNAPTDVIGLGDPVVLTVTAGAVTVAAGAGGAHVCAKDSANGDATILVKINVR